MATQLPQNLRPRSAWKTLRPGYDGYTADRSLRQLATGNGAGMKIGK
ncbi:hypothetical protein C4K38_3462 [Pseudomonas chlororaphis subsp. piscium]|nr:hypothetical protein C4K38_3462 [Pseudomonas chlororaphis subsp. piscium]